MCQAAMPQKEPWHVRAVSLCLKAWDFENMQWLAQVKGWAVLLEVDSAGLRNLLFLSVLVVAPYTYGFLTLILGQHQARPANKPGFRAWAWLGYMFRPWTSDKQQ